MKKVLRTDAVRKVFSKMKDQDIAEGTCPSCKTHYSRRINAASTNFNIQCKHCDALIKVKFVKAGKPAKIDYSSTARDD